MINNNPLLHSCIQCPDGTLLVSRHQHDFVQHIQADGREYFLDGGLQYQRIGYSDQEYINMSAYAEDPHTLIRERFEWGNRFDKDMKPLPKMVYIKLKDITCDHLIALVEYTSSDYPEHIHKVFQDELAYRSLNK